MKEPSKIRYRFRDYTPVARKHEPLSLSDALQQVVKSWGKTRQLEQAQLYQAWVQLMGAPIAEKTSRIWINKQIVYVELSSAPLKQELLLHRQRIRARLNAMLGEDKVREVRIF